MREFSVVYDEIRVEKSLLACILQWVEEMNFIYSRPKVFNKSAGEDLLSCHIFKINEP